jgi:hypothetical protein
MSKSYANGNGQSGANGDMQPGDPVPPVFRDWEVIFAREVSMTFWKIQP